MNVSRIIFDHYMLRDIELKDFLDMYEYGSDMKVVENLSWGPFKDKKEAYDSIKTYFLSRPMRGLPVGYAIIDLSNQKMIGTIDFHTVYEGNKAEIGYALNYLYWKKGIMSKALSKILSIGFFQLNYDSIIIKHVESNIGSKRVIEKNKFVLKEVIPKGNFNRFKNAFDNVYLYEMTKKEYEYDHKS